MKIVWAPNPLRSVVELDEHDKRWFRERLRSLHLEELISSAHLDLDPKHREWLASIGKGQTLEETATRAFRTLDVGFVLGEERNGTTLDAALDERLKCHLGALTDEHFGDCVCLPCSCVKCHAESILGIDTVKGLGKHEASKIGWAFKGESDGEDVTIDEALSKLKAYRLTYTPSPTWPEDEWQKHVPRWLEEAQRACEWLDAHRKERFSDASLIRSEAKEDDRG